MSSLTGLGLGLDPYKAIEARLASDVTSMLSESAAVKGGGYSVSAVEATSLSESVAALVNETYSKEVDPHFTNMIQEDARGAAQMMLNHIVQINEDASTGELSESASRYLPDMQILTASIATTIRQPYEATIHRMWDTRTLDAPSVRVEEVWNTVKAPTEGAEFTEMVETFSPRNPDRFLDKTEIAVRALTEGRIGEDPSTGAVMYQPDALGVPLKEGRVSDYKFFEVYDNSLFHVNRDIRVTKITVLKQGSTDEYVDEKNVSWDKGTSPYIDVNDNQFTMHITVTEDDGSLTKMRVNGTINWGKNKFDDITANNNRVAFVKFYATVDHAEHTHPITTGIGQRFTNFTIGTRPHIELTSLQEDLTDLYKSDNHFGKTDIMAHLTKNVTVISARLEDQRLKREMEHAPTYMAAFEYATPAGYAYGPSQWIKSELIPFIDTATLKMKDDYNLTDCHFRVLVSPYILRLLDTDFRMDKSASEDATGAGLINYTIGAKTSTSHFFFVSSQYCKDNEMQILLIPNNFKVTPIRTYNYFKYNSFMTRDLRRHDNPVHGALVYSERNLPVVFTQYSMDLEITGMPITNKAGDGALMWVQKTSDMEPV